MNGIRIHSAAGVDAFPYLEVTTPAIPGILTGSPSTGGHGGAHGAEGIRVTGTVDDARTETVRRQVDKWVHELIDLGANNTLLNFKQTKNGSLDLTEADPAALHKALSGGKTQLRMLFPDPELHREAIRRATQLQRKITAFREEQGVEVGHLACGLVGTQGTHRQRGRAPLKLRAPLLLRPVTFAARTSAAGDFSLTISTEAELNPVLLYALNREFGVDIDAEELAAKVNAQLAELDQLDEQIERAFGTLTEHSPHIELELTAVQVIGTFRYQKLPMVRDLQAATELLSGHDLVASLAGDALAAQRVHADGDSHQPTAPDELPPEDEYLVVDANSSQHAAIDIALNGQHLLIEGPPGTGKSQTIANIIAGAAAKDMTVLFVTEKRAAIEVVTDRLADLGLDGLVMDLHRSSVDKRHVSQQLNDSFNRLSQEPAVDVSEVQHRVGDRRRRLNEYAGVLHEPQQPWGRSTFEVRVELMSLDPALRPPEGIRLQEAALRNITGEVVHRVADDIAEFVDQGGPRVLLHRTPWSQTQVNEQNFRQVLVELDQLADNTLRGSQRNMGQVLGQLGLPQPQSIQQWQQMLEWLGGVEACLRLWSPNVFQQDLDAMYWATADSRTRTSAPYQLSWRQRRAWSQRARSLYTAGKLKKTELHQRLGEVLRLRGKWQQAAGPRSIPQSPANLTALMQEYGQLRTELASVAASASFEVRELEAQPLEELKAKLEALRADRETVFHLPKIRQLRGQLEQLGLGKLLHAISELGLSAQDARTMFRQLWLRGLEEEFRSHNPVLREFTVEQQDRLVGEFQRADREHRDNTPARIRHRLAVNARQARDEYPKQAATLRDQASKKRKQWPVRKLVEQTQNVLLALRPCWTMSPLVVSQTLPARKMFDLVIFDEASQLKPHEAITSIMRGRTLVVAGDEHQLPPSDFFDRQFEDETDDREDAIELADYESLLTALRPVLPHRKRLRWHYRSEDERLIAFSNEEIYDSDLVTFPGVRRESPVRLELVDSAAPSPGTGGVPEEEVRRVVELVTEHARQRPDESLGVITLGATHQERIEGAIRKARTEHPELDEFFAEDTGATHRFFVKNIETVQGDERDAIILTLGVARGVTGRVNRQAFGPLNSEAGVRRLNVAVTRASYRMTVVSSFPATALEPDQRRTGTELLRRFLELAQRTDQDPELVGRQVDAPLNGFERDIVARLEQAEIAVYPQWGVSEFRIDFALSHPEEPSRMVLAVEADGDGYHRSASARDRDRLRQETLERLGWRFHRVWASAWFADPQGQTETILRAWWDAVAKAEYPTTMDGLQVQTVSAPAEPIITDRGTPPLLPDPTTVSAIDDYTEEQLIDLMFWLMRDGLQLDRAERIDQAMRELPFRKKGAKIVRRLEAAARVAQDLTDQGA